MPIFYLMESAYVSITRGEYDLLKSKAKIADDAIVQLRLSLEDLKAGRAAKFL
jgi:hypothetical protein